MKTITKCIIKNTDLKWWPCCILLVTGYCIGYYVHKKNNDWQNRSVQPKRTSGIDNSTRQHRQELFSV